MIRSDSRIAQTHEAAQFHHRSAPAMLRRSIVAGVSTVRRLCTENVARASAQYTCASVAGNSQVSASAAADGSFLQALQSEIGHELGFDPFEVQIVESLIFLCLLLDLGIESLFLFVSQTWDICILCGNFAFVGQSILVLLGFYFANLFVNITVW